MSCALPLVRGYICGERSCVLTVIFAQILSGGSLCGKSCVDELVEILLWEGGDLELGARTSQHIFMFAFDPLSLNSLSLSLSYIVPCIISYCSFILICLVLLFVCHTCVKPRELHTCVKSRGVSPEPFTGNSATLFGYTKCVVLVFKFRIICH